MLRRRTRRRHLSLNDKIEIAHKVFIQHEHLLDVARHFRVTISCISRMTSTLRKKPNLLAEWLASRDLKQREQEALANFINEKIEQDEIIDSAEKLAEAYRAKTGTQVKTYRVRNVMKEICGLKWKKVKALSIHENSTQNLVLRQ